MDSKLEWNGNFAPFLDRIQSHDILNFCLDTIGVADKLIISTFAINEAFVRRLILAKSRCKQIILIWDITMATRNPKLMLFVEKNIDKLHLVKNHSKMIYVENSKDRIVAISSVNATGNSRYEGGLITKSPRLVDFYKSQLDTVINNSTLWNS